MKTKWLHFFQPYRWQSKWAPRKSIPKFSLALLVFFAISAICNAHWRFPYFYLFFASFTIVILSSVLSETRHTIQINKIRALTGNRQGFKVANSRYTRVEQTWLVGIIAVVVVAVFGIGGMSLFGAVSFSPTLILCLIYFSAGVYLSIVGYVQYIMLLLYIIDLARDKKEYRNVGKELADILPAEINWLHCLTRLTHFYRSVFFTIGTFYIAAFWFFCTAPGFSAMQNHWAYYLLWGIIFLAIVVMFPIVSLVEFYLIKVLVRKVKRSYISEMKKEVGEGKEKPETERKILNQLFATSILQSSNYPVKNRIGTAYAAMLAVLNLIGSLDTAIQLSNHLFPS